MNDLIPPAPDAASSTLAANPNCAQHGWAGSLEALSRAEPRSVLAALQRFVPDAGEPQIGAWREAIRLLTTWTRALLAVRPEAAAWSLILEYEMPMESRRADAVLLTDAAVLVLEFKGKTGVTDPDLDQAHAYARDLRCYHDACHDWPVLPVLVPTRAGPLEAEARDVLVRGPAAVAKLLLSLPAPVGTPLPLARFLAADAYRPLPTLVEAARELFQTGDLRRVHRAAAVTDGAVVVIAEVAREAAATGMRRLVVLTGAPNAHEASTTTWREGRSRERGRNSPLPP